MNLATKLAVGATAVAAGTYAINEYFFEGRYREECVTLVGTHSVDRGLLGNLFGNTENGPYTVCSTIEDPSRFAKWVSDGGKEVLLAGAAIVAVAAYNKAKALCGWANNKVISMFKPPQQA